MIYGTPTIVTSGLVLLLDAANTKSYPTTGTTWTDLSGLNNDGTLVNGPTFSREVGGGLVLLTAIGGTGSTVDQRVSIANSTSLQMTSSLTVDMWFKASGSTQPSPSPRLVDKSNWFLLIGGGTIPATVQISVNTSSGTRSATSTTSIILDNTWINITGTYDGRFTRIYRNGVLNNSSDGGTTTDIISTSAPVILGDNTTFIRAFNGTIANTKIYNRALSATEILQNYNALKTRFGLF
jgi:hypothetical protein